MAVTITPLQTKRHLIIQQDLERIIASDLPWQHFFGKTVLITGANGFVPAYMLETFLYLNDTAEANIHVIALVRNAEKAMNRLGSYKQRSDMTLVVQDVRDEYTGPKNIDFIIHAASPASPKYYSTDPVGTFEANVIGTQRMLSLAKEVQCEGFLYFSSGDVYGRIIDPTTPIKETDFGPLDPTNIRSCYGEGKRAGETLCISWHAQFGVPTKIIRLSHTYGPGMVLDDGRVFADFVADVLARRDIVMKSDGMASRPFCYLADATIAFFSVLLLGKNGEAYNVGSDKEHSILQLAETIANLFPDRNCRVIKRQRSPDDTYLVSPAVGGHFDISKIKSLGWDLTTGIEEGFTRTIKSYE